MASETPGSTVSLVGQGSFLTKPSLHMVGCTGKRNGTFTSPPDGLCPLCKTKGQSQVLKTYRINFTQSIFLCSDPQCIYPLGYTPLDNIITNTTDLNSFSPSKQKKRDISELSPQSLPTAKRSKFDLPLIDQSSPIDEATSVQAESRTSVQAVPPWEPETTSSGISQCGPPENTEIPETSSTFTFTALNGKPFSPLPPPGLHYISPGSPKLSSVGQDRLDEEPLQSADVKMEKLWNTDTGNMLMKRSDTEGLEESEDRELKKPEPYPMSGIITPLNLVQENRITLNGSQGNVEHNEFSPDSVPSSKSQISPSQPQENPLCSQKKDGLPQEVPSTIRSGDSVMPISKGSSGDLESAQPCDIIETTPQDLCESPDHAQHNTIAVVDASCAEDNQHRDLSTSQDVIQDSQPTPSESTLPVAEQDKSEHILNKTSLKTVSEHHIEASAEKNINADPSGPLGPEFSKALHLKQDSCGVTSASNSQPDSQPTCLPDNCSVDVCEQPCTMTAVLNAIEELTAASLRVCQSSASLQPSEDSEKMHMETTPSSCSEEDIQPELALEVDSSLGLPGISCTTDAAVDYSCVRLEEAPLSEGLSSDRDDLVGCQQSDSETVSTSASVQDILPECESQEKCLSDAPLTPSTSFPNPIDLTRPSMASAEIVSSDTPVPEQLDLIYGCQKSVCDRIMPSDTQVTRSVHDSSLTEVHNTVCPLSDKDDNNIEQEITTLPDDPLLGKKKSDQDSVEPCGVSTPPQNIQASITIKDNSNIEVSGSPCAVTSAMDDGDNAYNPAFVSNSQIKNNGNTLTSCSQTEAVAQNEVHPLHDTVVAEDSGSGNQAAAPLSDSAESKGSIMKPFENTVLPDLLLDIQPEHRIEDQIAAVPSPACNADVMVPIPSDSKRTEEGNLLQVKLDKVCVQEDENKMEITDSDISHDELQSSINLSDAFSLEDTRNNESIDHDPLDLSVIGQSQPDKIPEARTFNNSQKILHWKNKKSLCWLDCILSALVQSRTLGLYVAKHGNDKESIILNLFVKYEEAAALCKQILKNNRSGKITKAEACLNDVRMHIFDKLKPLLKCELGEEESPVFALPLLLRLDVNFQKLFEHSFTWNFKCESCGYTYQDRCQKTMTTFTKIIQDWRPLNAVHRSPCNNCQAADQRREMQLETLQSMFMLHFVEGLPSSDLKGYAFQFGEHRYKISAVIRYRDQHFSTWMSNSDDTWLESDDLKGSFCRRHQKFRMRAEDIHVVIWERSEKNIQEESPQCNGTEHVSEAQSENQTSVPTPEINPTDSLEFPLVASEANLIEPASTEPMPQVTLRSKCGLSGSPAEHQPPLAPVNENNLPVSPLAVPASVTDDTSNPLAGMEGYADDDIITLTLVEIPFDSMGHPVVPKPPDPGAPQAEANSDIALLPASVEFQNDCVELPQHTDPGQSTHLPSRPPRSDATPAPVCTSQQNPVRPHCERKKSGNMIAAAVATSTPSSKAFSTNKSIVDNIMGPLVKDDHFFVNSNFSRTKRKATASKPWQTVSLLKDSDFSGATKKADNFEGFRTKTIHSNNNTDGCSLLMSKLLNNPSSFSVPKEKSAPSVNSFLAPAALGHMKPGKNGLSNGKNLAKDGGLSGEDKVRKLRIKLLKKLKAKKNELAMLEKISKLRHIGTGESNGVQMGGVNRREHLRGFLKELQDQLDNADNESIGTVSSSTSICSSPGDAEFFAELFSPSPVENPGNDSRFLEMLADGYGISADHSQQAPSFNYPVNNTTPQATSGADSLPNTFNQSSSGEDSLNLLSTSTMSMLNDDAGYLDSFVDIF